MMLNDRLLADQGLLSRFLITAPDSAAGTSQSRRAVQCSTGTALRLLAILEEPLLLAAGKSNELVPRCLTLSSGAAGYGSRSPITSSGPSLQTVLWSRCADWQTSCPSMPLALLRSWRWRTIWARPRSALITCKPEHYVTGALRLFGASRINSDLRLAQRLLDWLLGTWSEPAISMPDTYQRSLNAIGDKATAAKLIAILEDHGWVVRIREGAVVSGRRRRDAWRIVRGTS
jgi:hypothetical protein